MGFSQGFRGPEPLCVEARLPRTTQGLRNAHTKGFRRLNMIHYTDITLPNGNGLTVQSRPEDRRMQNTRPESALDAWLISRKYPKRSVQT
jgi:hypothetical protein